MKKTKLYNPNNFNAGHAAIAYIIYIVYFVFSYYLNTFVMGYFESRNIVYHKDIFICLSFVIFMLGVAGIALIMSSFNNVKLINGGGFLVRKGLGSEILMSFVAMFAIVALFMPAQMLFNHGGNVIRAGLDLPPLSNIDFEFKNAMWSNIYVFLLLPLFTAVCEELLFRGVILKGFMQYGKLTAVILSSLLYAFARGNYNLFLIQFISSMVIGFIVLQTRNIFIGIISHLSSNICIVLLHVCYDFIFNRDRKLPEVYASIINTMWFLLGLICLVTATFYFIRRMIYLIKKPKIDCPHITSTFVEKDLVSGSINKEVLWSDTGILTSNQNPDSKKCFISKKGKICIMNSKSNTLPTVIFIVIGILISIAIILVRLFFS